MTLDLYRHGQLAPLREWTSLPPEERRRRSLLEAHHARTQGHQRRSLRGGQAEEGRAAGLEQAATLPGTRPHRATGGGTG